MRFRLLSPHFSEEGKLLDTGTEVGDGTEHQWLAPPTPDMVGLDAESAAAIEGLHKHLGSPERVVDGNQPPGFEIRTGGFSGEPGPEPEPAPELVSSDSEPEPMPAPPPPEPPETVKPKPIITPVIPNAKPAGDSDA